ncbi:hypothetical protein PPTG_11479 [Phytophthora nicotianae INRA-310]|uniref:NPP1-like protein n=1 Tax=Phytophthora nicotianae (strain INRA-310) TaxID=761204 RepID=W2Q9S1_PHYN3|nr:hypothetical protein PPTG_11479 [Phytophthora nicotianae INRA-310]ETN09907.1 hypothetical protein PPTG_11479 [Phytophthora nicotianae INRA-310]
MTSSESVQPDRPHSLIIRGKMKLRALTSTLFATLVLWTACTNATIDHDKVLPFPQPEPVTISEKAAITFQPQLYIPEGVCVSYPAVNAAGETIGGLKGSNGNDACMYAPLGSQVYGRARWFKDLWANPDLEMPKIVGVSMSESDTKYNKRLKLFASDFAGFQTMGRRRYRTYIYGSNTSLRFQYGTTLGHSYLTFSRWDGDYQGLIMWEQLTDEARAALNDGNNFEKAEVPFSDEHYEDHLDEAWPL